MKLYSTSKAISRRTAFNRLFQKPFTTALHGIMVLGLAFSTLGAAGPRAAGLPQAVVALEAVTSGGCLTKIVRITLASEQVSFCAPASLPFDVVEDSISDPYVSYAGLDQRDGYGIVNIKATAAGNTPGPGRPVYHSGDAAAYRQSVWNTETSRKDRSVSNGPSGVFWDETVPSIQTDLSLTLSTGNLQVRSIEWYVVHNSRLWSFILTWDTAMQNASEWEAASRNMSVQKAEGGNLADTAINLGAAFQAPESGPGSVINRGPIDVGTPAWWSGVCDDNNYHGATGLHSIILGAPWHGVLACGTNPLSAMINHAVQFFPGAWGQYEFECVELVMRFLYLEWGISPWGGNANQIKNSPPGSMVFYENNATHGIVPGDIITENASAQNPYGHTLIVTDISHLDGSGTGTINIMEQNASYAGQRSLVVENWQVQPDTWCFGQTIQGWLHVKGNQDDGDTDPSFTPGTGPDGRVNVIAVKPSGKILIAGEFSKYNGTPVNRVARLNSDGSLDTSFNPVGVAGSSTPHLYSMVVYSDGKVLIGGHFDSYNNTARKNIARLNSNGSLDTTFTPAMEINADVYKIVIQANGKILVGGAGFLHRLNSDGSLDTGFSSTMDGNVNDIAIQPADGRIVIGGSFSKVGDEARAGIARLNSDGLADTDFNPGTGTGTNEVEAIGLDPDGKVLIGGTFTSFNGTSRNKVARLNSNGSLDASFNPGTGISGSSEYVQTILVQADGRILIGGDFSSFNGTALSHFGRLNYDGSPDTTFYASLDGLVQALILQPDGKILIGGDFTNHVARLYNRIESCYTLATQVNLAAGGSVTVDSAPNCPGSKYLSGTLAQITPVPNLDQDYLFLNWSGDASGSNNPLSLAMNGNKSVTANFMTSPGHFNKTEPGNGTTDVPANPSLSWGTSEGASSYEYCLDKTNNNICDSSWVSTGTNTIISLSNLLPSVTYYWQARARNPVDTTDGGPWWSFTRDGYPAVPIPVSPSGKIFDDNPPYVWKASNGSVSYQVTVYSISASTNVMDERVGPSACLDGVCTYHPSVELPPGDYQFRIAATAAGTSTSPWETFSVGVEIFLPATIWQGN